MHRSKAIAVVAALAVLSGTTPKPVAAQKGSCGWIPYGWGGAPFNQARHGGSGWSVSDPALQSPLPNHDNLHSFDTYDHPLDHDHMPDCGAER